jgi:hypothetical protein
MAELPSVLGVLKANLVPFSQLQLQDSVSQWTNSSPQWLALLGRTRVTSSARGTIFVDHFSRLSYVYLQESTKGVQTLAAKQSFEAYASTHGVKIRYYHADNRRFAEKLFLNHCELAGQKVSLCGVSANFQTGIAERRIKDLTERSRTSLLHAMHRWPSAITINLWP